jgi:glucosylceramidase
MKHLSHFIQPGSKMIKVSNIDNTLAFKSADGKIVIVIYNPSDSEAKQSISVANRRFDVTLPAKSINTVFIVM